MIEITPSIDQSSAILPRVIVAAVLAALLGWALWKVWWGLRHVSTDSAQIEGRVVPILAKISGVIADVRVDDYQHVNEGDRLLSLDDADQRALLRKAEAELEMAQATAGRAGKPGQIVAQKSAALATAAAAHASVERAMAAAEQAMSNMDRVRLLRERGMSSQQAMDAAVAEMRSTSAQVQEYRDHARAADEQAKVYHAGLSAANAQVAVALAQRDLARLRVDETRIEAPLGGVVSHRSVVAGQSVKAGQPLMHIVAVDDIWIIANFKETDLQYIGLGSLAVVAVDAYPSLELRGVVETFSPATGARFSLLPPDNATGNFTKVVQRVPVKIRLNQSPHSQRQLRPGMSVTVTIEHL
ncbi:MAG: HlyD family secretion protein [Betaproteobacteria bacterium]|nr:HlyD family secretion protein [Betaproteobacteria bacterium]